MATTCRPPPLVAISARSYLRPETACVAVGSATQSNTARTAESSFGRADTIPKVASESPGGESEPIDDHPSQRNRPGPITPRRGERDDASVRMHFPHRYYKLSSNAVIPTSLAGTMSPAVPIGPSGADPVSGFLANPSPQPRRSPTRPIRSAARSRPGPGWSVAVGPARLGGTRAPAVGAGDRRGGRPPPRGSTAVPGRPVGGDGVPPVAVGSDRGRSAARTDRGPGVRRGRRQRPSFLVPVVRSRHGKPLGAAGR